MSSHVVNLNDRSIELILQGESMLGNCLNNDRGGYRLRYLNFILQKQWKSTVNQEKEALLFALEWTAHLPPCCRLLRLICSRDTIFPRFSSDNEIEARSISWLHGVYSENLESAKSSRNIWGTKFLTFFQTSLLQPQKATKTRKIKTLVKILPRIMAILFSLACNGFRVIRTSAPISGG